MNSRTIASRTVVSRSAALACTVAGPPPAASAGVVVILHAGVADRRGYRALIDDLAPHRAVVAYDRRGFGDTVAEPEPHSDLDDLTAVLDAIGAPRASLIGNSRGGALAIDFALAHPGRVERLITIGTAVSGNPGADPIDPTEAALDQALAALEGQIDAQNALEAEIWLDGIHPAPTPRVTGAARDLFLAMNRRALTAPDPGPRAAPPPAWTRLAELRVPTTVVVGAFDLPSVRAGSRHVAGTVPGASLVVLPDTAHLPSLDAPERLIPVVRQALGIG
ncbi:MAG: alpha/beta hydrolase [Myxococcota bacterium]